MQVTIRTITISRSHHNLQAGGAAAGCSVENEDSSAELLTMPDGLSDRIETGPDGAEQPILGRMAGVAVSRQMFAEILSQIARLRAPPAPA
jgi:hypothetical protein